MFVLMPIEVALHDAMSHWRDHDFGSGLLDRLDQGIGIEGLVCDHGIGLNALDQRLRPRQIVRLSTRQFPPRQISQPFDQAVNLGAQPPARAPDRLIAVFFGAPAACW